jgi:catechol 2,3-dioxygenase-like lactoylglutathione lyase family enzyme
LIDHTGVGVSDIVAASKFYHAALGTLGMHAVVRISETGALAQVADKIGGVGYGVTYPVYWIDIFHPSGARQHTAFRANDRKTVNAFHAAALAAGGRDNGAPGLRTGEYPTGYYAAFVLDPDGNNIEAVYRER